MRIGLNTTDPQPVLTEQAKKPVAATPYQPEPASAGDQATLSEDNVTLSALATQVLGQPEVRQSHVDSLRESINNGQYKLDPRAIADAILKR